MHEFVFFVASSQTSPNLTILISAENRLTQIPKDRLNEIAANRVEQIQWLRTRYTSPSFSESQQVDNLFSIAKKAEKRKKIKNAVLTYKKIINIAPGFIPAYYQLHVLYKSQGENDKAGQILERLKALKPEQVLTDAKINGLTVTGYQYDALSLETLRAISATIYWQTSLPICPTDEIVYWQSARDDLYCVNNKIFQITNLTNLASVGEDLRYSPMISGLLGYRSGSFTNDLRENALHKFSYTKRNGIPTIVFMLNNPSPMKNILISPNITVEPSSYYLLSSWIKTDKGEPNAGLGVVCFGENYADNQRHYIPIRGSSVREWTHFANIFQVEENARTCRVLLMNYGDTDTVYFDDVIFAQIHNPDIELR